MTTVYYKATRPDRTDFWTGTVLYAVGETVSVSLAQRKLPAECCTGAVLHAATVPTETLSGEGLWPCRLFEVTGRPAAEKGHKRGFRQVTVLREIDAHLALGPQGREVASLIKQVRALTTPTLNRLSAARYAARYAARDAAWDAAGALVIRDLIGQHGFTQAHYDLLTVPWRRTIGPIHPDDPDLREAA